MGQKPSAPALAAQHAGASAAAPGLAERKDPVQAAEACRKLHATVAQLLNDSDLLQRESARLMPPHEEEEEEYDEASSEEDHEGDGDEPPQQQQPRKPRVRRIWPDDVRQATQYLIDRLGCRHPDTLQRVTSVYAGFAGRRDGLTETEFQGYIACVLTQLQHELEARCAAAGLRVGEAGSAGSSATPTFKDPPIPPAVPPQGCPADHDAAPPPVVCADGDFAPVDYGRRGQGHPSQHSNKGTAVQHSAPRQVAAQPKGAAAPCGQAGWSPVPAALDEALLSPSTSYSPGVTAEPPEPLPPPPEPMSELQMLAQELDGFNDLLSRMSVEKETAEAAEPAAGGPCVPPPQRKEPASALCHGRSPTFGGREDGKRTHLLPLEGLGEEELQVEIGEGEAVSAMVSPLSDLQKLTNQLEGLSRSLADARTEAPAVASAPQAASPPQVGESAHQAEAIFPDGPPVLRQRAEEPSCPPAPASQGSQAHASTSAYSVDPRFVGQPTSHQASANPRDHLPLDGPGRGLGDLEQQPQPQSQRQSQPQPAAAQPQHLPAHRWEGAPLEVPMVGAGAVAGAGVRPEAAGAGIPEATQLPLWTGLQAPPSADCLPGGAGPDGPARPELTAKDLGVVAYGADEQGLGLGVANPGLGPTPAPACAPASASGPGPGSENPASWGSRLQGATSSLTTGWKAFADTMDKIFDAGDGPGPLPKLEGAGTGPCPGPGPAPGPCPGPCPGPMGVGMRPPAAMGMGIGPPAALGTWQGQAPVPSPCPCPVPGPGALVGAPQDVPLMFRAPTAEETRDLLEQEGLPAYVALGGQRGFVPKRLCLDGGGRHLYVLEADSRVPSVFFGLSGFALRDLRRIVHGSLAVVGAKPLLSLEFQEGFLPVRLGDPSVLRAFVSLLASLGEIEVVECSEWA